MTKYQCNKCGKVEHRSIPGAVECYCGGMLRSEFASICSYCGEIQYRPTKQCQCGNTMLTHCYKDEPEVNASLIKEILSCVDEGITTAFACKCGASYGIYRTTRIHAYCTCCGELMGKTVQSLRQYRKRRGWTQALMAAELGISRRAYIDIENGKAIPSAKTRLKTSHLMGAG
jgi:DNA-binding XRE family transcriptional regulator